VVKFAVIGVYLGKDVYKSMNTETNEVSKITQMVNRNYVLPSAEYSFISTFFEG
jgi:hypothetical protein